MADEFLPLNAKNALEIKNKNNLEKIEKLGNFKDMYGISSYKNFRDLLIRMIKRYKTLATQRNDVNFQELALFSEGILKEYDIEQNKNKKIVGGDIEAPYYGNGIKETSIKTYQEILDEGIVSKNQELVFKFIRNHGGLTDMEIAKELGFPDPNVVRPRRKELLDIGLIISNGKRKCEITNRESLTWIVPEIIKVKNYKVQITCPRCHGRGWISK